MHHAHCEAQEPTQYVAAYTAPATLITQSCKVAKNTTDGWTKTLYSGGDPTQYASMDDLKKAILNGTGPSIWTPLVTADKPCTLCMHGTAIGHSINLGRVAVSCAGQRSSP